MAGQGRAGAASRSRQAFNWLLSGDDGERPGRAGGTSKGKAKGAARKAKDGAGGGRRRSDDHTPGFQLRADAAAGGAPRRAAGGSGAAALQEAFAGVVPPAVVRDVLAACGGDPTAASEALLALAGGGDGGDAAGGPAQAGAACPPAAAAPAPAGPCHWDTLPEECKRLVFGHLSLKDLARAARACSEFAAHVRDQRRSLQTVVVPEGVSLAAVRSLVAAFPGARGVALWRCTAQLRFEHEFGDVLRAVAAGEADRVGGVPVSQLSLARCGRATDGVVAVLCDTLACLRRLDLARCVEVGDAAMARLAAYQRQGDEEEGEEGEAAAAAAAVQQLQLSASPPRPTLGDAPGVESPDTAMRRILAQQHAGMLARSAAAARTQHGRGAACGLQELSLRETSVSMRGVRQLLQPGSATSKSLKVLDVSRCPNLGFDLDLHPRAVLQVLRASGATSLRSLTIQLPPEAPLRTLHLDGCRQLTEVHLVAPHLHTLNLSHCGQLCSLTLRCRRLRELKAVNCTSLSLSAGELLCPELQEVNLFGCRQLDVEGLEAAAPSLTQCVSLDLTGCISLPRLLLPESTALRSVSVAGCGLMRQVLLASPALSQFKAAGCGRLMSLRLGTASLSVLDLQNCSHLREVQLSEQHGAASPPAAAVAAVPEAWPGAWPATGGGAAPSAPKRQALVLKGCTALPEVAKAQLRAAVLGR